MVDRLDSVDKFKLNSPSGTHIFSEVKVRPTIMSDKCSIWVRNHNAWDANDGGQIAIKDDLVDLRWGGLGLDIVSSFIVQGPDENCKNKKALAYAGHDYLGFSHYLTSHKRGIPRQIQNGAQNNMESLKFIDVPKSKPGHLVYDLPLDVSDDSLALMFDSSQYCHFASSSSPTIYGAKCYYNDGDETKLRSLHNKVKNENSTNKYKQMSDTLKEDFCKLSKNVFKNPGGGPCLEYDTAKELAKDYCSVGNRMATDASCTPTNLGNFYPQVATNYCKTAAGKADDWCSCYNVTNNVCDTDSGAAGCAQKRQTYDKLVEATPQDYKNSWSGMAACFGGVCQGVKYVPVNSNQNCSRPVQVCVQNFDIQGIADSTINARCDQTANTGTPSSAGDTPSGTPSGTPTPSLLDTTLDLNNNTTRLVVGGVGGLFVMCCCLLVIILMSSGGRGGGSSRFRR